MTTRREFLAMAAALLTGASATAQPPNGRNKGPRQPRAVKGPLSPLAPLGKTVIAGAPTDTSARLNVLADEALVMHWRVGDSPWSAEIPLSAGEPREIALAGLVANASNRWSIEARRPGEAKPFWSPSGSIQTARVKGKPFRFAVHADPHNRDDGTSRELHAAALQRTAEGKPDFVIDLGDNFMTEKVTDTAAGALQCVRDLRPLYGLLSTTASLFLMNGNHEAELGWLRNNGLANEARRLRRTHYPAPANEPFFNTDDDSGSYYAWEWGDALFVLLDPFWFVERKPGRGGVHDGWAWTLGARQHAWLTRVLRSSSARAKFVFCHHLVGGGEACRGGTEFSHLYEWGGSDPDGRDRFAEMRPGWSAPIHRLMAETGVTIFFHGHDHFYARQEREGVVYQLVPQPSHLNTRRHSGTEYGYREGTLLPNSGFLEVDVLVDAVEVRYVRFTAGTSESIAHQYRCPLKL